MAKAKNTDDIIERITDEATSDFDMRAWLAGQTSMDTKDVVVYTDQKVGRELGGSEDQTERGINIGRRRWGIQGRIEEIEERAKSLLADAERYAGEPFAVNHDEEIAALENELKALQKRVPPLLKKLEESSMTFTLRAVPKLVLKDARRKARKALGIKQKGIPQDKEEEYTAEYTAIILAASVVKWVRKADGIVRTALTVQQARDMDDMLPPGQFEKLDRMIYTLSIEDSIGRLATDSADF